MKYIITVMLCSVFLAMSQGVLAHPGHDGSHWASDLIHALTVFAVGSIIVGGFVYKQLLRRRKQLEREEISHDA
ncbi:hypothetical protein EBI01_02975 [Marinomonas rhizomae]|uniref:CcmD family protein n=1 Tax=Marinomonas rhizomae TaxID=491948 RepID=A0A366JF30_9GAMM|nr:hypothetical protein [Marinomonas rhizomae]RBP85553.1 hypothetical protein DFP80_10148 [Marinomonas rhizomae]RNF75810.1 hypothetical protein EBI01_02975 [Marinomonas rhizomae]